MLKWVIFMKKFKDLRMTMIISILFIGFSVLAIISIMHQQKAKMIIALIAAFISLIMMLTKYKIILFDDVMMIYVWQVAAMLPVMIKYEDIKNVSVKSKHCVLIEHKKKNKVYVFNSEKFVAAYHKLRK